MNEIKFAKTPALEQKYGGEFLELQQGIENGKRKGVVEQLVTMAKPLIAEINQKHAGKLSLALDEIEPKYFDDIGWTIFMYELEVLSPEFLAAGEEPFIIYIGKILLSELEVNQGMPKIKLIEWIGESGQVDRGDGMGKSIDVAPEGVILFLEHILETGSTRLQLK